MITAVIKAVLRLLYLHFRYPSVMRSRYCQQFVNLTVDNSAKKLIQRLEFLAEKQKSTVKRPTFLAESFAYQIFCCTVSAR